MKIQDIAQKMARGISVKKDADNASAPLVAYMIHVATSGSDAFDNLRELYMFTFEAAASTKKKAVQSFFTRMGGLMSALVEHANHEVMADTIDAEMALVRFEDGKLVRAQDAKRFPKAPQITRAGDAIRRDWAQDVPFSDQHEHADVSECDTVGEALTVLDEEITRLAEIKGSLEAFRTAVLNEAVGEPIQFEIGGDTNVAPSFSLK
jgi:hypothetical protein